MVGRGSCRGEPGRKHLFEMPSGTPFFVYRTDDEVRFDVFRLKEGGAGNALYATKD
ncbi:hypothetical protein [Ruegeria alba]|uniref:hypothetical protein n=1 Tax=Ruegeria alba TaxID=2916756 RepID=UPI003F6F6F73